MKTLLVCLDSLLAEHVGEEYDDILEVTDIPTAMTIQEWAHRVRDRIRRLWESQSDKDENRKVSVWLHGPAPFNAVLINLQIFMKEEEAIVVDLPYLEGVQQELTDEMKEALGIE